MRAAASHRSSPFCFFLHRAADASQRPPQHHSPVIHLHVDRADAAIGIDLRAAVRHHLQGVIAVPIGRRCSRCRQALLQGQFPLPHPPVAAIRRHLRHRAGDLKPLHIGYPQTVQIDLSLGRLLPGCQDQRRKQARLAVVDAFLAGAFPAIGLKRRQRLIGGVLALHCMGAINLHRHHDLLAILPIGIRHRYRRVRQDRLVVEGTPLAADPHRTQGRQRRYQSFYHTSSPPFSTHKHHR